MLNTEISAELSSLFDDELDADRQKVVLAAVGANAVLRTTWDGYQLVGDALRRSPDLSVDLTRRVMDDLRHEPTVLAPQMRSSRNVSRYAAALAASLAGVGVVGWLALSPSAAVLPAVTQPVRLAKVINTGRIQEYLVAHQAYSPNNHFDGGASYIRTVFAAR